MSYYCYQGLHEVNVGILSSDNKLAPITLNVSKMARGLTIALTLLPLPMEYPGLKITHF